MRRLERGAFRALCLSVGASERELAALAKAEAGASEPLTQAQRDRLASIDRREEGSVRLGVSRLAIVRAARPGAKSISEPEAAGIMARRIGRSFDVMRMEARR